MQAASVLVESNHGLDGSVCQGRVQQLQEVFSHYLPSLHRMAFRYLGNADDAEDAVQDALLSAFTHLDQFRGQAQMSTWVTSIVTNAARMTLRRRPRQIHLSIDEPLGETREYFLPEQLMHHGPSPEEECSRGEQREHLLRFVQELSPSLRKAFQLRVLNGLNTREASMALGVSEGTLKAQLARARSRLRGLMSAKNLGRHKSRARKCRRAEEKAAV